MKQIEQAINLISNTIDGLRIQAMQNQREDIEAELYEIQMQIFKLADVLNKVQNDETTKTNING